MFACWINFRSTPLGSQHKKIISSNTIKTNEGEIFKKMKLHTGSELLRCFSNSLLNLWGGVRNHQKKYDSSIINPIIYCVYTEKYPPPPSKKTTSLLFRSGHLTNRLSNWFYQVPGSSLFYKKKLFQSLTFVMTHICKLRQLDRLRFEFQLKLDLTRVLNQFF